MITLSKEGTQAMHSSHLANLLAPISVEEFLTTYFQQQPLFVRDGSPRFEQLLTWEDFNSFLKYQSLPAGNVSLVKEGRFLDAKTYLRMDGNRMGSATRPRLLAAAITQELRNGATLVIDKIDDYVAQYWYSERLGNSPLSTV